MNSLYYKAIRPAFDNRVSLLFSDTDSFGLLVPANNTRDALARLSSVMDFSNLPKDDPMYDSSRKCIMGYLKLETNINDPIARFVGLKAKTYAFQSEKNILESRCKGVKKNVKQQIRFESYLRCIKAKHVENISQYCINSKSHVNRLIRMNKVAFSSYDEKRFLMCAIHSVPYGSIMIKYFYENNETCFMCQNPNLII